ncbi:hypothetical protein QCB44_07960 [Thiomicrorhabdus sp. zzn3]|uniref:hypothetical protein n=1 Tax=Thiomicrorhabdus sp. zzn3 TaxID=3039775 RepID=UPI002436832A|nr:hypothetical protein [Thiomicrorhabdus sp. zzn3]MDG6778637.1 hypothetical protein [Thiomicrorhabdus sp. zzn3]
MLGLLTRFLQLLSIHLAVIILPINAHAGEETLSGSPVRAILLTPVVGQPTPASPQPVRFEIIQGQAKGCLAYGNAYLNNQRKRYEYKLKPVNCVKNGQTVTVGQVVRGQHNIKGTMANSGMGRSYLISNKGVTVTLAYE